jgi:hypothetical protein
VQREVVAGVDDRGQLGARRGGAQAAQEAAAADAAGERDDPRAVPARPETPGRSASVPGGASPIRTVTASPGLPTRPEGRAAERSF